MKGPAALAWLALPIASFLWPLAAQQQQQQHEGEVDDVREGDVAPLVSELTGTPLPFASHFGASMKPESVPVLVATPAGAWLVALEWEPGKGDRIVARALLPSGDAAKSAGGDAGAAIVVEAAPHELLKPAALLDGEGKLVVAWTEVTDEGSLLRAARLEGDAFTPPVALTAPALHARNVALALHGGRLWCCFEQHAAPAAGSDKGHFDVLLAPLDGLKLGEPVRVGSDRLSGLDPVAASGGGKLWVAWSGYGGRDYEILLRSYVPASGQLGETIDVSADSDCDDLHPALAAAANGELWLAWDRLRDPTRGSSMPRTLRDPSKEGTRNIYVMSACVREGAVLLPEGRLKMPPGVVVGAPQFSWTGGLPRLAVDAEQRPWICYRYLNRSEKVGSRSGDPVVVQRWNGAGWSAPLQVGESFGPMEPPALTVKGSGALVAFLSDHHFDPAAANRRLVDAAHFEPISWVSPSTILVAAIPASAATGGAAAEAKLIPRVEQLSRPHYHPSSDLDDPYVSGARHFEVDADGKRYRVFWGDLHRHSGVSKCTHGMEERPIQRWDFGRDVHLYDFMALTDHSDQFDPASWWLEDKLVRLERGPDLCTLAGYEWSTQLYGHQNVILAGRIDPVVSISLCDPPNLYKKLSVADAIAIPHGTADQGRNAVFDTWDDRMVRLVEVYQAMRGSSEFDGCVRQSRSARVQECFVQDALEEGHKFGLIASTDHGGGCAYAVALAERLDVPSLMEAFRARRTYAATTKGMLIDFRIDGRLMGEEVRCGAPPKLSVKVRGAAELAEVVVFRDAEVFQSLGRAAAGAGGRLELSLQIDLPSEAKQGEAWRLKLAAPGCALERIANVVRRRSSHKPPFPRWRTLEEEAVFLWPETFDPDIDEHLYRLKVTGPADTRIRFEWGEEKREVALRELLDHAVEGTSPRGPFKLTASAPPDAQIELEKGLGVRELTQEWTDAKLEAGDHWYYARAIQVDGEIVWSSPIFVMRE